MNTMIEISAAIGGTRTSRRPEGVDLHPAQGIIAAIGLSLLLWATGLTLLYIA